MARRHSASTISDDINLEARPLSSSPSRIESFSTEDDDYEASPRDKRQPNIFARALRSLGMTGVRRRGEYDRSAPLLEPQDGLLAPKRPPRETRTCRKGHVCGSLKRAIVALPFVALMVFGALHLVQAIVGRSSLLWDAVDQDDFMPDWGKLGHVGSDLASYPTDATRDVLPIPCHSHNDYWRRIPLFEALHWGCTSVEADVWLFDDDLYVGHSTAALTKNRTFRSLYVNPLRELLDHMNPTTDFGATSGHGVFDTSPNQTLVLLVDFKTSAHDTYDAVYDQLSALREKDYLTYYSSADQKIIQRQITVVGTGNTPFDLVLQNSTRRDIFFDAPLDRLWDKPSDKKPASDSPPSSPSELPDEDSPTSGQGTVGTTPRSTFNSTNSYYASVSFARTIGFVWLGHLSPSQLARIRGVTQGAHARGLKVRWWDTPAWPVSKRNHIWSILIREGSDMLNVDDLKGAATEDWRRRVHRLWD